MTHTAVLLLALSIGVVAGLRSLTAPAVLAWAAWLGWLDLDGTWASWMASVLPVSLLTVLAVLELVFDALPAAPDRTEVAPFGLRIVLGGFAGAVVGASWGYTFGGLGSGVVGAVLGTLAGYGARQWLVGRTDDRDLPIALLGDAIAVLGGFAVAALAAAL